MSTQPDFDAWGGVWNALLVFLALVGLPVLVGALLWTVVR